MKIIEIARAQTIANAPTFTEIGGNVIGFLLKVLGFFAIIGLVITAIIYFTSGGEQSRVELAKRSFFYSIVGIIISLGTLLFISQMTNLLR